MQLSLEAIYQIRACVHIAFFFSGRKLLAVRSGVLRWSVVRWEKKQPALYDRHGALQITMFPIWHPDIRAGRMWERDCYHLSQEEDMERWHPDFWFKALGAQHKYGVLVKKTLGLIYPFLQVSCCLFLIGNNWTKTLGPCGHRPSSTWWHHLKTFIRLHAISSGDTKSLYYFFHIALAFHKTFV